MPTNKPKTSAKNESGEFERFENSLRKVLSVSHSELKARMEADKRNKPKISVSRDSDDKS